MEKIAIIMNQGSKDMVLDQKTLKRLESIGEVTLIDGDIKAALRGATIAITSWGNTEFTDELLNECPELKLVAHAAGSVKPIVSPGLWRRGIRVVSSANTLSMGVSETALGFTIAASKDFFALNARIHEGKWNDKDAGISKQNIRELYDLTIGVVGGGWAGRHYIELMSAFDVEILLYDPFVTQEKASKMGAGAKCVSFEELLKSSDIISIHAPSIPETHHMFNKNTLALMKKDAVLINTARGSLIDEDALYEFMSAGNLKYACLDVFDPEPPRADHPLRSLENCIITPHLAGLANNGLKKIGKHVCEEIERFLSGQPMLTEVTEEMLSKMA